MKKILITIILFLFFASFSTIYAKDFNLNTDKVYVSGETIGLKLNTGVVVTKLYSINVDGQSIKPWESANIRVNDVIVKINDVNIVSTESVLGILKELRGECSLQLNRNGKIISTHIMPLKHQETTTLGLFVKDNVMGVGTMTFITEQDLSYASLGHQIVAAMNAQSGSIYDANVIGIDKSTIGQPGSKKATVDNKVVGDITLNSNKGVYGNYSSTVDDLDLVKVKSKEEIKKGEATILTCVDKKEVLSYDIDIVSIDFNTKDDIKGLKIKITDQDLIDLTGGVIQGMSGSPIMQDNMLVGAITHVVVNSPEYGYGVFAENMLKELDYNLVK